MRLEIVNEMPTAVDISPLLLAAGSADAVDCGP